MSRDAPMVLCVTLFSSFSCFEYCILWLDHNALTHSTVGRSLDYLCWGLYGQSWNEHSDLCLWVELSPHFHLVCCQETNCCVIPIITFIGTTRNIFKVFILIYTLVLVKWHKRKNCLSSWLSWIHQCFFTWAVLFVKESLQILKQNLCHIIFLFAFLDYF